MGMPPSTVTEMEPSLVMMATGKGGAVLQLPTDVGLAGDHVPAHVHAPPSGIGPPPSGAPPPDPSPPVEGEGEEQPANSAGTRREIVTL
jgi:hypothetical protein